MKTYTQGLKNCWQTYHMLETNDCDNDPDTLYLYQAFPYLNPNSDLFLAIQ